VLALVLTLILALYVLGPDLFSRVVVSWFAPARPRIRNRGEEVARAVLISAIPVGITYVVEHCWLNHFTNRNVLRDFLYGLYGETSLAGHADAFIAAAINIAKVNFWHLLLPSYLLVFVWSVGLGLLIRNYGRLLRRYENCPKKKALVSALVRPRAAEWHLKLSQNLLPSRAHYIQIDVLALPDVLFSGTLAEHHIEPDGSLVSVTLTKPRKYRREELLEARKASNYSQEMDKEQFWTDIPGRSFILMADKIISMNVNYIDPASLKRRKPRSKPPNKKAALAASKALAVVKAGKPLGKPGRVQK
jgi:hypothetical protein